MNPQSSNVLESLEQFVSADRLGVYRRFVAYQLKHHPTDEIGQICQAAGWLALLTRETPERLATELQHTDKLLADLTKVTGKMQEVFAAAEKIENARDLLQNSEALGTAVKDAKKTIGILHWQLFGWLAVAALIVALAVGISLGYCWNQKYRQSVLSGLQQSEQLNKALIESGRSMQFLRDEDGTGYILMPKAEDAFIGKNGQGIIKIK